MSKTRVEWLQQGKQFAEQKEFRKAIRCFNEVLTQSSTDYEFLKSRIDAFVRLGKEATVEEKKQLQADIAKTANHQKEAAFVSDFLEKNKGLIESAPLTQKTEIRINLGLAAKYFFRGKKAYQEQKWAEAYSQLSFAAKLVKDNQEISNLRLFAGLQLKDESLYPDLKKELDELIEANPNEISYYLYRAQINLFLHSNEEAQKDFIHVLKEDNRQRTLRPELCQSLLTMLRDNCGPSVEDYKESYSDTMQIGKMAYLAGKDLLAIERFTQAIKLNPKNPYAYAERGLANARRKKINDALIDYSAAIWLHFGSDLEEAYFPSVYYIRRRNLLLDTQGDLEEILSDHEAILEIERIAAEKGGGIIPGSASEKAHNLELSEKLTAAGKILLNDEEFEEAEAFLNAAIEYQKNCIEAYIELSVLYRRTKRFEKADEILKKGLEISPENGRILAQQKKIEQARAPKPVIVSPPKEFKVKQKEKKQDVVSTPKPPKPKRKKAQTTEVVPEKTPEELAAIKANLGKKEEESKKAKQEAESQAKKFAATKLTEEAAKLNAADERRQRKNKSKSQRSKNKRSRLLEQAAAKREKELKDAETAKLAEAERAAEAAKLAEAARAAEEAKLAEAAKKAATAKLEEPVKIAEVTKLAEPAKLLEEQKKEPEYKQINSVTSTADAQQSLQSTAKLTKKLVDAKTHEKSNRLTGVTAHAAQLKALEDKGDRFPDLSIYKPVTKIYMQNFEKEILYLLEGSGKHRGRNNQALMVGSSIYTRILRAKINESKYFGTGVIPTLAEMIDFKKDIDIVTTATEDEIMSSLAHLGVVKSERQPGLFRLEMINDAGGTTKVEIWLSKYWNVNDDAYNRVCTGDGLYAKRSGDVIDPLNRGYADVLMGKATTIKDAKKTFSEDILRLPKLISMAEEMAKYFNAPITPDQFDHEILSSPIMRIVGKEQMKAIRDFSGSIKESKDLGRVHGWMMKHFSSVHVAPYDAVNNLLVLEKWRVLNAFFHESDTQKIRHDMSWICSELRNGPITCKEIYMIFYVSIAMQTINFDPTKDKRKIWERNPLFESEFSKCRNFGKLYTDCCERWKIAHRKPSATNVDVEEKRAELSVKSVVSIMHQPAKVAAVSSVTSTNQRLVQQHRMA